MVVIAATGSGQTITIGTGTASTLYGPIYIFSSTSPNTHSWNLTIYDQSEIFAAGGQAADITGISWYKTDTSSYLTPNADFQIYIKHTPVVSFVTPADFDIEVIGSTHVYHSLYQSLSSTAGWITFPFFSNFTWNGIDNIMILTHWARSGNSTGPVNWLSTNTNPLIRNSYSFNTSQTMGGLVTSNNRPDIQLTLSPSTSIGVEMSAENIRIFPNPAKDFFIVEEVKFPSTVTLTDITGKIVFKTDIPQVKMQKLSLTNIPNGIYEVIVLSTENTYRDKLVIAK